MGDIIYVVFPVAFIWKLNMPLRRKIGIVLLMAATAIAFAAALSKAVVVIAALTGKIVMTGPDFGGLYFLVSVIEQCLVIMVGCVPSLGPISKLQFPTLNTIGETLASLLTRGTARTSKKGSSIGSAKPPEVEDIEMCPQKIRLADERFPPPSKDLERTGFVQGGNPNDSLVDQGGEHIYTTNEYEISYESNGWRTSPA